MTNTTNNTNRDPLALLERVRVEQEHWRTTMYESTNAKLLSLLSDCLDAYYQLSAGKADKRKAFNDKLATEGLTYKEGVHLSTKIVHYVFRLRTGRAVVYARVLRLAIEAQVEALTLSSWVTAQGGVEAVRRQNANDNTPAKVAREKGKRAQLVLADCKAEAALSRLPASLLPNTNADHEFSVALVRVNSSTKTAEVVWGTNDVVVVRRVLDAVGKDVIAQLGDTRANRAAEDAHSKQQRAIENAANGEQPQPQQAA